MQRQRYHNKTIQEHMQLVPTQLGNVYET